MQKQKCKILGLLVVLCMLVTALPIQVFAEELGTPNQVPDGMEVQAVSETTAEEKLRADITTGGEVILDEDVVITQPIIIETEVTLDLNGHEITVNNNLWNNSEESQTWSVFSVRNGGNLTIINEENKGGITAKKDDSYVVDLRDSTSRLEIDCTNDTKFVGNMCAIYVFKGEAVINGGTFSIDQKSNNSKPYSYILNCYDDNAKDGSAKIMVTGGVFVGVDPSNTKGDPTDPTNYVAEGYIVNKTKSEAPEEYTVTKAESVEITKATLHDASDRVEDSDLYNSYEITEPSADGKISVTATELRIHKNAQKAYGHWAGVEFKAPKGYTLKYKIGNDGEMKQSSDGTLSIYLDTTKSEKKSVEVTIELYYNNKKVSEKTYTIDFSKVTSKQVTGKAYYSNFADSNIVKDCIDQTMYVVLDEPLDPEAGILFEITSPDGKIFYMGSSCEELKEGSTGANKIGVLPTKFAWSFLNNDQTPDIDAQTGTYKIKAYKVKPEEAGANALPSDAKELFDTEVYVEAPKAEVVDPAEPEVAVDGIDPTYEETVKNAMQNVKADEGTLKDAAVSVAVDTEEKDDYSLETGKNKLEQEGIKGDDATVEIVYQPYLDVKATAYDNENKSLTVDITPMVRILATTDAEDIKYDADNGDKNAVVLGTEELTITEKVELTIGLPIGFAEDGETVYVQHKGYQYNATVKKDNNLVATFTNPHGFSEFTVTTDSKVVAIIGNTEYTSLEAAVQKAQSNDTIILKKEVDESIEIDEPTTITIKIDDEVEGLTVEYVKTLLKAGSNVTMKTKTSKNTVTFTFTKKTSSSSTGGNGGSATTKYTITVSVGQNGNITPTGKVKVEKGEDQKFDITPNNGYVIDDVLVDGKSVGAVEVYTFEKVEENHTLSATFKAADGTQTPIVDPTTGYVDVAANAWFKDAVKFVTDNNLMNGTGNNKFEPDLAITRGMLATVIYRLAGADTTATATFTDVPATSYYSNAIAWAAENGIVTGVGENRFEPDRAITREEMATMISRYITNMKVNVEATDTSSQEYADASAISEYAVESVKTMRETGLMEGKNGNNFDPKGMATRAEVATILMRFVEKTTAE